MASPAAPSTEALPNPWASSQTGEPSSSSSSYQTMNRPATAPDGTVEPLGLVAKQQGDDIVVDLGYSKRVLPISEYQHGINNKICLGCCPCCVGSPSFCSPENKEDLKKLFKTFIFWITVLQIAMFLASLYQGFAPLDENPMIGPPASALEAIGANFTPLVAAGQVWRLFTCILLHGGIVHIVANLMAQLTMGIPMEYRIGTGQIAALYLTSGILASIMSGVGNPYSVSVGASGAILGLIGCQTAFLAANWHAMNPTIRMRQLMQLGTTLVLLFLLGLSSSVDNFAHFGGFLAGFLLSLGNFSHMTQLPDHQKRWLKFGSIGFVVFLWLILVIVLFAKDWTPGA